MLVAHVSSLNPLNAYLGLSLHELIFMLLLLIIKVHVILVCFTYFYVTHIIFEVVLLSIIKKGEIERASRPLIWFGD